MLNDTTTYKIEQMDVINKTATFSTYDTKHKMNVTLELFEDESTAKNWISFWDMFAQSEARKLN